MKPIRLINKTRNGSRTFRKAPGWKIIDGVRLYLRSEWELKFARFLAFLKHNSQITEWEYEPKTFWFEGIKRGVCSYVPDFKVTQLDGTHYWVEVKGYMDPRSQTKIKRFKKYFPEEQLRIIDSKWFYNLSRNFPNFLEKDKENVV